MRWARKEAGYKKATDAARALSVKPVTYRTWEQPVEHGGRWPETLSEVQRIARHFKVSWTWLADGKGTPFEARTVDARSLEIVELAEQLSDDRRDDALNAALAVLRSYV